MFLIDSEEPNQMIQLFEFRGGDEGIRTLDPACERNALPKGSYTLTIDLVTKMVMCPSLLRPSRFRLQDGAPPHLIAIRVLGILLLSIFESGDLGKR